VEGVAVNGALKEPRREEGRDGALHELCGQTHRTLRPRDGEAPIGAAARAVAPQVQPAHPRGPQERHIVAAGPLEAVGLGVVGQQIIHTQPAHRAHLLR
jgi:hypothetical protein